MTVPFIRKSTQRNSSWPGDLIYLQSKAEYICADLSIRHSLFPCSRAADHTFQGTTGRHLSDKPTSSQSAVKRKPRVSWARWESVQSTVLGSFTPAKVCLSASVPALGRTRHPCKSFVKLRHGCPGHARRACKSTVPGCFTRKSIPLGIGSCARQNQTSICCLRLRRAVTED